jgi:hypothetical protein
LNDLQESTRAGGTPKVEDPAQSSSAPVSPYRPLSEEAVKMRIHVCVLGMSVGEIGALAACGKVADEGNGVTPPRNASAANDAEAVPLPKKDAGLEGPYIALDASARTDATRRVDEPGTCSSHTPCDCDEDGFAALDCTIDAGSLLTPAGVPLQPGDCDDLDPLRFPGQAFVSEPPPAGQNGDWNCDGEVDVYRTEPVNCSGRGPDGCSKDVFFRRADPSTCGQLNQLYGCIATPLAPNGCGLAPVGVALQPCK